MRQNLQRLGVVFTLALALLLLGPAAGISTLQAEDEQMETTLSGQLSKNEAGSYVLVEQDSGDEVLLEGPETLEEHLGAKVKVTGRWDKNDAGQDIFKVSAVERLT